GPKFYLIKDKLSLGLGGYAEWTRLNIPYTLEKAGLSGGFVETLGVSIKPNVWEYGGYVGVNYELGKGIGLGIKGKAGKLEYYGTSIQTGVGAYLFLSNPLNTGTDFSIGFTYERSFRR
ncbi:MAG: hypothetical protein ACP5KJ_03895, partial [Candidatus Micrarchaeia archaeon]